MIELLLDWRVWVGGILGLVFAWGVFANVMERNFENRHRQHDSYRGE